MSFTRTKIVCTIGPATSSYEKIVQLIEAGMNVARINFSHGSFAEHEQVIHHLKKARASLKVPLAIMIDIKGPEIRVGKLEESIPIKPKMRFKLVPITSKSLGQNEIPIRPIEVFEGITTKSKILFDDGSLSSIVLETGPNFAIIEFQNGGLLKSGKGINIPGAHLDLPAVTQKDIDDLKFGCKHDVDLVAASFIRSAHHILSYKQFLVEEGKGDILVIAKIEDTHGIENFDSIVQVADGIMIARGDLGVEVELSKVPKLQKMMIRKCYQACKPSITATQMLESMIVSPRPTRAEVSDVANAIYDSTSAIMLSGESAVGSYPIEAVQKMKNIARETEADFPFHAFFQNHSIHDYHDLSSAVVMAAIKTAYSTKAKAIFAFTTSGMTARLASRLRPEMPIIAVTTSEKVYHQLAHNWGVIPIYSPNLSSAKEAFSEGCSFAMKNGFISFGDIVVITAGVPFGKKGSTNMMTVQSVGEILVRGHVGCGKKTTASVAIVLTPIGLKPENLAGRLVVISHCDASFIPVLKQAAGVILQNYLGDKTSEKYAELVAKTFNIPVITRADGAMSILQEGEEVTLDPQKGIIYRGSVDSAVEFLPQN